MNPIRDDIRNKKIHRADEMTRPRGVPESLTITY